MIEFPLYIAISVLNNNTELLQSGFWQSSKSERKVSENGREVHRSLSNVWRRRQKNGTLRILQILPGFRHDVLCE